MSKKVMVLSKKLEGRDLSHIDLESVCKAYTVPNSLVDIATVMLPNIIGLDDFSLDVPKFDKKQNSMEIVMHKKSNGDEKWILKIVVSFDDKKPHALQLSDDGGDTWKEITYKGNDETPAPAEA
jgi:hypothetical protein